MKLCYNNWIVSIILFAVLPIAICKKTRYESHLRNTRSPLSYIIRINDISDSDKTFIVRKHTNVISKLYSKEKYLHKIIYDINLERLSQEQSHLCHYKDDKTDIISQYNHITSNIYITSINSNLTNIFDDAIDSWFYANKSHQLNNNYEEIISSANLMIGCGTTFCGNVEFENQILSKAHIVVCSYRLSLSSLLSPELLCSLCSVNKYCTCSSSCNIQSSTMFIFTTIQFVICHFVS